jgi:hypothetical protein
MAPRESLPTGAQIRGLPYWARVAFAVRCARRVQELFESGPGVQERHKKAVTRGLEDAERACANAQHVAVVANDIEDALIAVRPCRSAYYSGRAVLACVKSVQHPDASDLAAQAAFESAKAIHDDVKDEMKDPRAAREAEERAKAAIKSDWEFLWEMSRAKKWDDKSPVSVMLFPTRSIWPKTRVAEMEIDMRDLDRHV